MDLKFNKKDKIFISIIVLVHLLFFLLDCTYKRIYMGDSYEYIYEALNIKNYGFFYSGNPAMPISPEYMTQRQPVYPLFLLAIYMFAINNWVVLLVQNTISVFNIYYSRKILLRTGYDAKYDWVLLLLTVAYPAQFINANTIAPDILLQSFTLFYFGSFILFLQNRKLRYAIWMSLALIAGMFVKPVLYPFALVHVFIIIGLGVYHKLLLQRIVLTALIPVCAVLCYNYSNYIRTGKFHFTSNQSFNAVFYYYSYFSQKEGADSAGKFLLKERRDIASIPDYKDRYDYANERGMELLKQNFFPYMAYHLKNSARIFIEPGKAEMDLFTGKLTYGRLYSKEQTGFSATIKNKGIGGMGEYMRNNPSLPIVLLVLLFNFIRLVGMVLFFFDRKTNWLLRLFTFIFLVYFAIAAGPIANTRYFLPVSLIAIGVAAVGYLGIMKKRTTTP